MSPASYQAALPRDEGGECADPNYFGQGYYSYERFVDIDAHRATMHISAEQYVKQRSVELGQSLGDRFALYPDQNFWIAVRKADNGSGTQLENELLRMLRELAREGAIFC